MHYALRLRYESGHRPNNDQFVKEPIDENP